MLMAFALHISEIAEIGDIYVLAPFTHKYVVACIAILSANTWLTYMACERTQLQVSFKYN